MSKVIRHDIYAIKEFDGFHGHWCYTHMSTDKRFISDLLVHMRMFEQKLVKLVHPSQEVVNCYLFVGNKIL